MEQQGSYTVSINPLGNEQLKGSIRAAASKSSMQRACAAALVAGRKSIIHNPGNSNDDKAALDIIKQFGASIEFGKDKIVIDSLAVNYNSPNENAGITIHCGESGLSIRMFTPIAALFNRPVTIQGTGSLMSRPMDFFDEILPGLGVKIQSNKGKLPIIVQGPIKPSSIEIDGSLSSQFLTGLLLAFSASKASNVSIIVNNLKSKPYIDLTLDVMQQFGLAVPENRNFQEFYFATGPVNHLHHIAEYTVEGDWSGGAFLLVAGAIAGPITVTGLDIHSTQADKAIMEALKSAGAGIKIETNRIELNPTQLNSFHFDATDCPDLFPPLVALASYCNGQTIIKGVSRLAHKESNRGLTLQQEFYKMGVNIELKGDEMIVHGGNALTGARTHSHHDHRIAMACAVAALKANGKTEIEEAGAISKSYPDFYEHLSQLGADIKKDAYIYNNG